MSRAKPKTAAIAPGAGSEAPPQAREQVLQGPPGLQAASSGAPQPVEQPGSYAFEQPDRSTGPFYTLASAAFAVQSGVSAARWSSRAARRVSGANQSESEQNVCRLGSIRPGNRKEVDCEPLCGKYTYVRELTGMVQGPHSLVSHGESLGE